MVAGIMFFGRCEDLGHGVVLDKGRYGKVGRDWIVTYTFETIGWSLAINYFLENFFIFL